MLETLKRIASALEGVHTELKRLNDTNPSNQAQAKPKQDKKKSFEPKTLFEVVLMRSRNVKMVIQLSRW